MALSKDDFISTGANLKTEILQLQGYLDMPADQRNGFAVVAPADRALVRGVADDMLEAVNADFITAVTALRDAKQAEYDALELETEGGG